MVDAAGDSGVAGVRVRSVAVAAGAGAGQVTVVLAAPPVAFLRWLRLVPPEMVGRATATARLVPP
jgi:hypothetical protein